MANVQRAHPAARQKAILFIVVTAVLGGLLILAVNRYSEPLREWVLSDPSQAPRRLKLLFAIFSVTASAPLIVFAAYLWKLGGKVIRARQFPPPDQPLVSDQEIVEGEPAIARGRALKTFAVVLAVAGLGFWLVLWRLASLLRPAG